MDSYLRTLNQVSMAAKETPAVRPEERRDSHQALKEGDIVAVLADDNPNYFWSVRLGRNFTGQLTPQWSGPIYGTPPEGIPKGHTAAEENTRQANLQNLNAGVFSGGHVPLQGAAMNWCVPQVLITGDGAMKTWEHFT